ncbi:MAG: hypothetical protein HQL46_16535 [Gammaproteobacteria bacterium]|nr:hypothetical protein [Gammaproteobacteria bacterium]
MDTIINFLVFLTPVFIVYWILSMVFVSIGQLVNGGNLFLGFMRLWVKPLFLMNFVYFVVAEVIFSAVYWGGYVFSKIASLSYIGFIGRPLEIFYNFLFRIIPTSSGGDGAFETYLFISVVIFFIIMIPYIVVHLRLTSFFKKAIFKNITTELKISEAQFITQSPGKLLPSELVNYLVSQDTKAKNWIVKTFEEQSSNFQGDPKKFSLGTMNADHMKWTLNNQHFECWESRIDIDRKTPSRDSEDKLSYKSDKHTCLDGLVIKVNDIFTHEVGTKLYEVNSAIQTAINREQHAQGFWISIIEIFSRGVGKHQNESNTSLDDFPDTLFNIKLNDSLNLKYAGTQGKSLYLFIETRLDGTMFDFNQNIPVSKSIELFLEDLQFVLKHCQLVGEVKQVIQSLESESLKAIA